MNKLKEKIEKGKLLASNLEKLGIHVNFDNNSGEITVRDYEKDNNEKDI